MQHSIWVAIACISCSVLQMLSTARQIELLWIKTLLPVRDISMLCNWRAKDLLQLINLSNFYGASIPIKARLSGVTTESMFHSKIDETVLQHKWPSYLWGKGKVKEMCLQMFLEISN